MKELGIDIETYSSFDLSECGVYKYVESPDFEVLLFAYSVDGGDVNCVDLANGEELPEEVAAALTNPEVIKTAYNAAFERVCLSKFLGLPDYLNPEQWRCTMVAAARMGLPLSLGDCAKALKLTEGKMEEGRRLIRLFSKPDKKGNRVLPKDRPEDWEIFKQYNIRDVEVEQAILAKVRGFVVPAFDQQLYIIDQRINDRGALIDVEFVENAARFDEEYREALLAEAKELTGLDNPNSVQQLKTWLAEETHLPISSLNKADIEELGKKLIYWPKAQRVLRLRRELGKSSNKKYQTMLDCVCPDDRIRGLLQFYGAARTGRWAGRLVQIQNLPQNHIDDIDFARELVKQGDLEDFDIQFPVSQTLSELIRTAFVASPGNTLHVCDFSAIEARVIAWLAGERWVLEEFKRGGDIYCATASKMFGVPVEKHGANSGLRQRGKVAVLALGYGGGVAALEAMGGARLGLTEVEEREIVELWRRSNPNIIRLWRNVESAAIDVLSADCAVKNSAVCRVVNREIEFSKHRGCLAITLPSKRRLCYPRAAVDLDERGKEIIVYEGVNQTTRKWEKVRTYGGKLTENIVQAIARDILGDILIKAEARGFKVVFHVHDEIVVDASPNQTLSQIEEIFSEPPSWCRDLPLKGAGYSSPYYLKD